MKRKCRGMRSLQHPYGSPWSAIAHLRIGLLWNITGRRSHIPDLAELTEAIALQTLLVEWTWMRLSGFCFLTQARNFAIWGSFLSASSEFSSWAKRLLSNKPWICRWQGEQMLAVGPGSAFFRLTACRGIRWWTVKRDTSLSHNSHFMSKSDRFLTGYWLQNLMNASWRALLAQALSHYRPKRTDLACKLTSV